MIPCGCSLNGLGALDIEEPYHPSFVEGVTLWVRNPGLAISHIAHILGTGGGSSGPAAAEGFGVVSVPIAIILFLMMRKK